jgi:hypothetical protein
MELRQEQKATTLICLLAGKTLLVGFATYSSGGHKKRLPVHFRFGYLTVRPSGFSDFLLAPARYL